MRLVGMPILCPGRVFKIRRGPRVWDWCEIRVKPDRVALCFCPHSPKLILFFPSSS